METLKKMLIAYDGLNPISDVITDLKRAGMPEEMEVTLLIVMNPWNVYSFYTDFDNPLGFNEFAKNEDKECREKVDAAAHELRKNFPSWNIHAETTIDNSPAKAILRKEEEWQADLIVLGSHKSNAFERFFLGSIAHNVLAHAKCTVRIIRHSKKENQGSLRILLGMDTSECSQKAAFAVANRHWPAETCVKVVTAFDLAMSSAILYAHPIPAGAHPVEKGGEKEWIQRRHEISVNALMNIGLAVSETIKSGKAAELLLHEAREWNADCIFLGAHGLSAVDRVLLGSVSLEVAMKAPCSVEVVRR